MKYYKNILIALIMGLTLIGPSCDDFLEVEPMHQTYGGAFWVSEDAAEQAVAGAYALLRNAVLDGGGFPNYFTFGELMGEFTDRKGYSNQVKFKDMSFWNPNMGILMWSKHYKTIAQCNLILHEVDKLDDDLFDDGAQGKAEIKAEALFIRAYMYFYMTRIWGGVPLITEATTTVSQVITDDGYIKTVPRNTEEEVLTQCIEDLKVVESTLDYGTIGSTEYAVQASKGSAQALMAHMYLWIDKSAEAEEVAGRLINSEAYSLVDYNDSIAFRDMWIGRSSEGIFELNIDYDDMESYTNSLAHTTVYHPYIQNRNEGGHTWYVKPKTIDLYEDGDLRLRRFFTNLNSQRPNILKYASVVYEDESKFTNPHGICNVILLRLADIILLRAEALNNLGRPDEAIAMLNMVRERAEATPYDGAEGDLGQTIFIERAKELVFESQTYYDRIRCDIWEDVDWMSPLRKNNEGYYWGIANSYITNNPKLTQNTWWAMKSW